MSERRHDIVIVGGGLIGASLACALAPTGLDMALVEAVPMRSDRQPSYDEKMLSLAPASQRILAAIGVWPSIVAHGVTPIEQIHVSDRGHFGKTRLSAAELGVVALGYVTPARAIGQGLAQHLAGCDAVALYCPASVTALDSDANGVTVYLDEQGTRRRIRARLAVLADGGESTSRAMLGIRARRRDYGQSAILCTVTPRAPRPNTAFERFTNTGPLAVLPSTGNRAAVVWTARNEQVDELIGLADDAFQERLQARFGDWLGTLEAPSRRRAYPLTLIEVPNPLHQRALVIGNAAHTIHPVAGQGFNLGLRDVAVLAEVLVTHPARDTDVGDDALLRAYRDWRRRDTINTTRFTDGLIRVFANRRPALVAGRNIALGVLNHLPVAKRALSRRTMGLNGRLPRLARGLPLGS